MSAFAHPTTGEVLESHDDFKQALATIEEQMAPFYRARRQIRVAMADRFPAPDQPRPRERTEKQERVARCPRCGTPLQADRPSE